MSLPPKLRLLPFAAVFPFALPATSQAAIIVGWETWSSGSEAPSVTSGDATGLATENGDWREGSEAASNDGTFGTLAGASTASSGTIIGVTSGSGSYDFTVTAGATQLVLEAFHFDAQRKRSNSPENWSVDVIAGSVSLANLGAGTLGSILGGSGPSDHADTDLDMTGLADNVLDPGESATIRISFSGGNPTNTDQKTYLDNVAISGVPEPAAVGLFAIGLGLFGLQRRR